VTSETGVQGKQVGEKQYQPEEERATEKKVREWVQLLIAWAAFEKFDIFQE